MCSNETYILTKTSNDKITWENDTFSELGRPIAHWDPLGMLW